VEIVHEVLNGPAGQQKLAELNDPKKQSVEIRALILRQGDFDVFTVYRPREVGSQASFDWLSSTKGDGCIVEVFVLVIKVPGSSSEEIHIQTTHPKHYARTLGDEIVARRP
jgi:hypothetical protein